MNYYKLIDGETFVGIATQLDFRVYQRKHNVLLACDEELAQYIASADGKLYHAEWMKPTATDLFEYTKVELIAIEEDEYNALYAAIESGQEIIVEQDTVEETVPTDSIQEVTVKYVKSSKIAEMSNTCNKVITSGFSIKLSDDESHHFSLTTQDQLNLITLSAMIEDGKSDIPYHADGEMCKFYLADDVSAIIDAANSHKTYHISYFNSLKAYIETLNSVEDITSISYGIEIPSEYQSEVLKSLIAGGEA